MSHNNLNKAIVKLQDKIYYIINDGIINPNGYPSGTGGNCSDNLDFTNLTTTRLADCLDWNGNFLRIDTGQLVGNDLMENYGMCTVEVAVVGVVNTTSFDIYVDCSNLEIENRYLAYVEESISFVFQNKLNDIFISIEENANSLNTIGGNDTDGRVRARFAL